MTGSGVWGVGFDTTDQVNVAARVPVGSAVTTARPRVFRSSEVTRTPAIGTAAGLTVTTNVFWSHPPASSVTPIVNSCGPTWSNRGTQVITPESEATCIPSGTSTATYRTMSVGSYAETV